MHGSVTLIYGIVLVINPVAVANYMGLAIASNDGRAELVTMYAGMSGAVALFMLTGAINRKWIKPATLFLVITMTGIAVGRAMSFVLFDADTYTRNALLYDVPMVILAWCAYVRLIRPNHPA